ncbi:hypothetical protein KY285_010236 [Solanum tuberosum]|nr:hypothetical protein KY289_010771 [Solanum tuberosum]KAH0734529.1 hypothetical protein KY285_010236 [Solanum tuberosum]
MMKLNFATLLLVALVLTSFLIPATIAGSECHCVPSGTSGNKDECPCYRDKKNSKGGPKCP